MGQGFKLKDICDLDYVSYDEIDKICATYEDIRGGLEYRLKKRGSLTDPKNYEAIEEVYSECAQSKDIKKRRAILAQIREANLGAGK